MVQETDQTRTGARDLNRNGRIDPYEDPSLPIEERVSDVLIGRMTIEEKAGLMFQPIGPLNMELPDAFRRQRWFPNTASCMST